MFVVAFSGISIVDLEGSEEMVDIVDSEKDDVHPHHISARRSDVIFTDPTNHKLYKYSSDSGDVHVFAGNGEEGNLDGPAEECSFRQPSGIAVEFDNILYVTDSMSGTVHILTSLQNTVRFLRAVGGLYKAFSIHERGKTYENYDMPSAIELVKECRTLLKENEDAIKQNVRSKLPSTLNGPQGNVAAKTIDSVQLVEWGLTRLHDISKRFNYESINLLSCMTLDVEHFHSTTHFKSDVMSMSQYTRAFGNAVKESLKRLSSWSAFYFTHPRSWYPLPEGTISFKDVPLMEPLPAHNLDQESCRLLNDFASVYGRAVRQRSGRQETTKAKAGTLPPSCYSNTLPIQRVNLTQREEELSTIATNDEERRSSDMEDHSEYDSDESEDGESEDHESEDDDPQPSSSTETAQLSSEALFLIGSRSRFGRPVRFNRRFIE